MSITTARAGQGDDNGSPGRDYSKSSGWRCGILANHRLFILGATSTYAGRRQYEIQVMESFATDARGHGSDANSPSAFEKFKRLIRRWRTDRRSRHIAVEVERREVSSKDVDQGIDQAVDAIERTADDITDEFEQTVMKWAENPTATEAVKDLAASICKPKSPDLGNG